MLRFWTLLICVFMAGNAMATELSTNNRREDFGNRWVQENPFLIAGFCFVPNEDFDAVKYRDAGFNSAIVWSRYERIVPGLNELNIPWILHVKDRAPVTREQFHERVDKWLQSEGVVGCLVRDEPSVREMPEVRDELQRIRKKYPNIMVMSNAFPMGGRMSMYYGSDDVPKDYTYEQYVKDFIEILQPDIFMYDIYPFRTNAEGNKTTSTEFYTNVATVARVCREAGMPWWVWTQSYKDVNIKSIRMPSESELRMHVFLHLAFGCKGIGYFTYDYAAGPAMIELGTHEERPIYYAAAALNKELAHLGQTLRLLNWQDAGYIASVNSQLLANQPSWVQGMGGDPHLTSVLVDDPQSGPDKSSQNPAVVIGVFTDQKGSTYLLVSNIWHGADSTAAQKQLRVTLTFDDATEEVFRLSRLSGETDRLVLENHTLTLDLLGGTGELIKYDNGRFLGRQ